MMPDIKKTDRKRISPFPACPFSCRCRVRIGMPHSLVNAQLFVFDVNAAGYPGNRFRSRFGFGYRQGIRDVQFTGR